MAVGFDRCGVAEHPGERVFRCILDFGHGDRHQDQRGKIWVSDGEPSAPPTETPTLVERQLGDWWQNLTVHDIEKTVPKAIEYGAADLKIMGEAMRSMLRAAGRTEATLEEGMEAACCFYLLGKVARMFGALERGEMPSDDTWFDARIYTVIGQKIRDTGSWV